MMCVISFNKRSSPCTNPTGQGATGLKRTIPLVVWLVTKRTHRNSCGKCKKGVSIPKPFCSNTIGEVTDFVWSVAASASFPNDLVQMIMSPSSVASALSVTTGMFSVNVLPLTSTVIASVLALPSFTLPRTSVTFLPARLRNTASAFPMAPAPIM